MKRAFTALLSLALLFCAGCGLPSSAASMSAASAEGASDELIEVPIGEEVRADLDGDGSAETILYDVISSRQSKDGSWTNGLPCKLNVDGTNFLDLKQANPMAPYDYWMENPDTGSYYLVDLDTSDQYLEIAITDWGSSDYLSTLLFRYDAGGLTCLGRLPGMPDQPETDYHGDGTVSAAAHLNVMQTWMGIRTYSLEDGQMCPLEGELFPPVPREDHPVTLTTPLTVFESPDLNAATLVLQPSEEPLEFPLTDGAHWVQIKCADGSSGWAYFTGFTAIVNDGMEIDDQTVFDNLFFAG